MKNKKFLFVILIALLVVSVFLILRQRRTTFNEKDVNFSIADTVSVSKIFLADMEGKTVTLVKKPDNEWSLNGQYPAQKTIVQNLLRTMMYLTVRAPVPLASKNNVLRIMSSLGVKVEIYQQKYLIDFWGLQLFKREKLTRSFYVGDNTQDNMGTYMKMADSDTPFITYIPGFRGFVHTRFSTNVYDWRDHTVFNSFMQDIASVKMEYPAMPEKSFLLENPNNKDFRLYGTSENIPVAEFDTMKVISYMSGFINARFDYFVEDPNHTKKDSLLSLLPYQILTLTGKNGTVTTLTSYLKPNNLTQEELEARMYDISDMTWDKERMYALVNDNKEMVCIQYFVFGRILKPLQYFLKGEQE